MRKSIFLAVMSLVAILAVACGSGNTPANGGNAAKGNGAGGNGAACTGGGDTTGGDTTGGGTTGGTTTKTDPYALYKKVGRSWTTKSVMTIAGMPDPMISYTKMEVISQDDKGAKVKMTTMDKDKKETYSADQDIPFTVVDTPACTGTAAPKMTEETVKVEAGEFECYVVESEAGGVKSKSWSSKKYPGLAVKMETDTMKMELVEFKD
ncbi:MAG: hypothetical protein IT464_14295 [Planctomycetes bacterium]|nr:hypothetical protein [Planctomycetota bacterium]